MLDMAVEAKSPSLYQAKSPSASASSRHQDIISQVNQSWAVGPVGESATGAVEYEDYTVGIYHEDNVTLELTRSCRD